MKSAIYPGSFDPLTNGHVDIVERTQHLFDKVIVAVTNNSAKDHTFSVEKRMELAQKSLQHIKNVEVESFSGLLMDYAHRKKVHTILRGLRANSDFEYEFQLATINRKLRPDIETVLIMTSETSFYISSRLVREIAQYGGNVSGMVPAPTSEALAKHFNKRNLEKD